MFRTFRGFVITALCSLLLVTTATAAEMLVVFGSHTVGKGKGFTTARFDTETGKLSDAKFALETPAPSYFYFHPDGKHLYSVNSLPRGAEGNLSVYTLDAQGNITLLDQKSSGGGDPSQISLDSTGTHAFAANYQGGNICAYKIKPDGTLGERTALIQHEGKSVDPQRQNKPYAHCIRLDPSDRFAVVCDLGLDKLLVYKFDKTTGSLTPHDPPSVSVTPGAGPRHLIFHPNNRWLYAVTEMGSSVLQFDWDPEKGILTERQSISALPADYSGKSTAAEVDIDPSGKFLIATNRGHDSLAVFRIDPDSGKLTLVEHTPSQGKTPRTFAFDPTGRWVIVTNHGSSNGAVFAFDPSTGHLTPTGEAFPAPSSFGVRFLPLK